MWKKCKFRWGISTVGCSCRLDQWYQRPRKKGQLHNCILLTVNVRVQNLLLILNKWHSNVDEVLGRYIFRRQQNTSTVFITGSVKLTWICNICHKELKQNSIVYRSSAVYENLNTSICCNIIPIAIFRSNEPVAVLVPKTSRRSVYISQLYLFTVTFTQYGW